MTTVGGSTPLEWFAAGLFVVAASALAVVAAHLCLRLSVWIADRIRSRKP